MAFKKEQSFGTKPTEVRDSDHFTSEYADSLAEKWDDIIDWDSRVKGEGSFFIDKLREYGAKYVLDVAAGTGFHSVRLIESGFSVTSADGAPSMLAKAFENAKARGHVLRTVCADWRWLNRDVHGEYDAVICLGNSFTHLFNEHDRRKALAEYYAALKHDGVLIIDQRNYDSILDDGYSSKHKFYYCGDKVSVQPVHVDEGLTRFEYKFPGKDSFHLNMFPIRKDYMRNLLGEVGFQTVTTYGDFQTSFEESEPDFYVHVAEKKYNPELKEK
ncbi:class I SAM-dependent methyltransferase [Sedimentisphaera salicampi]|uniref:Glycine/sarcosine N-methyltransferase n=1 Tax=Sedimentisphaera salicampi TaxID=1941349 RepID=A0A1W6LPS9_9BACT|nr:class I SAM-dependent methyltransferase [Sedimentisphaera salicampi]ARN57805.1 Glycine/sarcosine N-methyltransferase [Sedimentisphaera salicampi]OXU13973.1 Glycine/sarcosine N-methyltransferase [Sedimentisphaera salicampi]